MDMITTQGPAPAVVGLDEPLAVDRALTGAKAANLAEAALAGLPVLPGAVLTTAWSPTDRAVALAAWQTVSDDGARAVVVRSSSTGEDGATSSMAGVFDSVLDVRDPASFDAALDTVLDSAATAAGEGLVDAAMAILVQPMLEPTWGGVLFTADPVTGRRDRLVVAVSPAGPAAVVSGEVDGWTAALTRRGRVTELRSPGTDAPPAGLLRQLTQLAARVSRAFGGPQDIEWSVGADGIVRLLQTRPITTLAPRSGPVFGAGPVAESFPDPLTTLEQDIWLDPVRDGLREALRLAGTVPAPRLARSPLVVAVEGQPAVDLGALGADGAPAGFLARLDPRPPARRLRAAWRVGRLRTALPQLAADVIRRVDEQLDGVPALGQLSNAQLLALLRNGRRSLVSLHGHEALSGLLIPEAAASTVTGASLALSVVAETGAECSTLDELIEHDPIVLALLPPRIGPLPPLEQLLPAGLPGAVPALPTDPPDEAALAREALRLRIRWLQELTGRAAWELGRRLVDVNVLPSQASVRLLTLDEVHAAVQHRVVPDDLDARQAPAARHLPARFRLTESGQAVAVPARAHRRRASRRELPEGIGAGGGVSQGPVHVGPGTEVPAGSVLVVPHLDPRLAAVIPRLAGLVAETGSPLSHLAILAREAGVPIVVGLAGATQRFTSGDIVVVDGQAGTVRAAAATPDVIDLTAPEPAGGGLLTLGVQP